MLRALREHIDGPLGLWEPMLLPGDSHEDWVQRWFAFASARFGDRASQADRGLMLDHVRTADLTRTIDTWESEAREAGWEKFEFLDSTADQTLGIMLLQ